MLVCLTACVCVHAYSLRACVCMCMRKGVYVGGVRGGSGSEELEGVKSRSAGGGGGWLLFGWV